MDKEYNIKQEIANYIYNDFLYFKELNKVIPTYFDISFEEEIITIELYLHFYPSNKNKCLYALQVRLTYGSFKDTILDKEKYLKEKIQSHLLRYFKNEKCNTFIVKGKEFSKEQLIEIING